jgi:hypothetical protein
LYFQPSGMKHHCLQFLIHYHLHFQRLLHHHLHLTHLIHCRNLHQNCPHHSLLIWEGFHPSKKTHPSQRNNYNKYCSYFYVQNQVSYLREQTSFIYQLFCIEYFLINTHEK